MTIAIAPRPPKRSPLIKVYGFSEESETLTQKIEAIAAHEAEAISLGWKRSLKDRIWDTFDRCSREGWDGGDAEPVSKEACNRAERFIDILPSNVIPPEVVPEADGQIALDWQINANCIFSIGFDEKRVNFAGYFGEERRVRGRDVLGDEIPEAISSVLETYFSPA